MYRNYHVYVSIRAKHGKSEDIGETLKLFYEKILKLVNSFDKEAEDPGRELNLTTTSIPARAVVIRTTIMHSPNVPIRVLPFDQASNVTPIFQDLEFLSPKESVHIFGGISPMDWAKRHQNGATPSSPDLESPGNRDHWSESLQAVLDQPPSALPRYLILAGLVFSVCFGNWAWFGKIQEVSHAQGHLIPEGEVYRVQPVVQGEVARILVQEGQTIRAGQKIVELDDRLAQTEVERLEKSLAAYQLQQAQTQQLIEQTRSKIETQQAITAADLQAQAAAISQAQTDANISQTLLQQLQAETVAHQTRLERLRPLVEQGALAEDYLFEIKQSIRDRQQAITQNQGQFEQANSKAAQLQAILNQRTAEGHRRDIESQQQLQQLEIEVAQIQAKIDETETLLEEAQTKLEKMFLYASVEGVVSSLNIQNVGEVVQPGQTIAEIAPSEAPLVLSAILPSREAGLVQKGMKVQMQFDAFPYQDYGIMTGTVAAISPDAKDHEQMGSVYEVEVELDRDYIPNQQQKIELKAGQTAKAEIIIRQRRIMDVLLAPVRQLQKGSINL